MSFKILIVDDEKDLRDLLRLFLSKEGYEADVAANGNEAFVKVQNWHPQLVITDIRMPHGDGFELLRNISKLQPPQVPVLVMSGYVGSDESQLRQNSNFVGLMKKPVSWQELINTVKTIEAQHQS